MEDANPYSAPGSELDQGGNEVYQPTIFSFNGRIGRLRYLAYGIGIMFLLMAVMVPLMGATMFTAGESAMSMITILALGVFYIAAIVLSVMFAKRRLNDLNRSGWWFLLSFVPVVNILLTIYLIFFPGTEGSNNWGPAPGPNSLGVKILALSIPVIALLGIAAAMVVPMMYGIPPQ